MTAIDKEIPQQIFTVSVISTAIFCRLHGREFTPPKPSYSYTENLLYMMGFVEKETGQPDPRVRDLLGLFPLDSRVWCIFQTARHLTCL